MDQAESETAAAAESESAESSLWQAGSERVLLHATILRALRFGDRPPPGFKQQVNSANKADQAVQKSSAASSETPVQSRQVMLASSADQSADSGDTRTGSAVVHGLSRVRPLSAARQQAAALLAEQPQAIRFDPCSCCPVLLAGGANWHCAAVETTRG
jgi:hypothetical protein